VNESAVLENAVISIAAHFDIRVPEPAIVCLMVFAILTVLAVFHFICGFVVITVGAESAPGIETPTLNAFARADAATKG
jgi:hypothetical protein